MSEQAEQAEQPVILIHFADEAWPRYITRIYSPDSIKDLPLGKAYRATCLVGVAGPDRGRVREIVEQTCRERGWRVEGERDYRGQDQSGDAPAGPRVGCRVDYQ